MLYNRISAKIKYSLSILIPTLPQRIGYLNRILDELTEQIQVRPVQVLYLGDNKSMSVGKKRNLLMDIAEGEYICFVDDDDMISETYIKQILTAIKEGPDVITFKGQHFIGEKQVQDFVYSVKHGKACYRGEFEGQRVDKMLPNHLCVWKKSVIDKRFPDISLSEDHKWAESMMKDHKEYFINDYLYYYYFDKDVTACRTNR